MFICVCVCVLGVGVGGEKDRGSQGPVAKIFNLYICFLYTVWKF